MTTSDHVGLALSHSEKLGLAFDPSVTYWRDYYARDPEAEERLRVFREALTSVRATGLWLDAGCGIGMVARQFRESGLRVCGIDMSAALLKEARDVTGLPLVAAEEAPHRGEHLCRVPVERTPYEDGQFDGAYSCSVLEYVDNLELGLAELRRVVRSGGYLVFNLPNAFSAFRIVHALRRRNDRYYGLVPRWAYWRWEITRILERSGWEMQSSRYYGAQRRLRRRFAGQPWAAAFVLFTARRK